MIRAHGALDRDAMRGRAFEDPAARRLLEAILHPMIREAANAAAVNATGPYTIFVVPLLVESGDWRQRVARVLVVDCPEALQVQRVVARNGLAESQVHAIMATQASRAERLAAADDVIANDTGIDVLERRVEALHQQYLAFAAKLGAQGIERL